jgi:hypothetical protein
VPFAAFFHSDLGVKDQGQIYVVLTKPRTSSEYSVVLDTLVATIPQTLRLLLSSSIAAEWRLWIAVA